MPHKFGDHGNWERLLAADRRQLMPPEELLERLGITEGMEVLDLGAGPGYFTLPIAHRVGPQGIVWAVDIAAEALSLLEERARAAQLTNVRILLSEEAHVPLPDAAVDVVLLAFVLHELLNQTVMLREVARVLKPNGALMVADWERIPSVYGPPPEDRISAYDAKVLLEAAGFDVIQLPWHRPEHYLLRAVYAS